MKTRMRFFSLTLCLCLLCSLLFCSAVNVSAATESQLTEDGWVKYTRLNVVQFTYKVNAGQNEEYRTTTLSDLKLPYGPSYVLLDQFPITEFWITVSLNNYDESGLNSTLAEVQPGETIAVSSRLKLWFAGRYDQASFAPIDASMYSCRIYLDDNYSKYLTPTLSATTANGGTLYYTFTNNTDKPIALSRVTFGVFDDGTNIIDSFGYGYYISGLQYRLFTNAQQAAQAVADSIDQQTEELKDSIQDQTDQITGALDEQTEAQKGFFERLGDRIGGFFENLLNGILEGLKNLFIPEDGYFTEYFAQWDTWMADHFGALYYPFDLMLDVLNRFLTLEVPDRPIITFPAIKFRLPGNSTVTLSEAVEVDILQQFYAGGRLNNAWGSLYEFYRIFVVCAFSFGLAALARKKLAEIMGGGSS